MNPNGITTDALDKRNERQTLTIEETARILGIGRSTAYDAARRGEIPTVKLGRRLLVPRSALDRLLGKEPPDDSHR